MTHVPFAGVGQRFTLSWTLIQESFRVALRDKGKELSRGDARRVTYQEFVDAMTETGIVDDVVLPQDVATRSCVCVFSPEESTVYLFITGTFCHGNHQVPLPSKRRLKVMARVLKQLSEEGGLLSKMGYWEPMLLAGIDDLS